VLQVRFCPDRRENIGGRAVSGDLIANPAAITAWNKVSVGAHWSREALWQVVDQIFLQPQHYLLGVGPLKTIPDTILKGYASSGK